MYWTCEKTGFWYRPGDKRSYVLLFIKGILMVAAIAVVSSSKEISMGDPCELKEALELISMNYAPFCKYNATIEKSGDVSGWGIGFLCGHGILFLVIFSVCLWPSENKRLGFLIIYILVTVAAATFILLIYIQYNNFNDAMKIPEYKVEYSRLKSKMLSSLETHFKSDDTNNGGKISSGWNNLFIKYSCCAVNEVNGTTNDFDNTMWCTTNGSCQATASQIPKTCCKDVTTENYQNASSGCHASVNPGTYKPGCLDSMRSLSVVNIEKSQVVALSVSIFTLMVVQVFETAVVVVMTPFLIWDFVKNRKP